MPKYSYDEQKESILRWRKNHIEQYRAYNNEYRKKFYVKNIDKIKEQKKNAYQYKKECKRLCNIEIFD
jgi:hypothetical protein